MQFMSAPHRPQGAFDTSMAVYDSSGNVVAYNDDSFQDTDSKIIDLTLPATGTYYVEVSRALLRALGQPLTGAYELFIYTFASDGSHPPKRATRSTAEPATTRSSAARLTTSWAVCLCRTRSSPAQVRSPRSARCLMWTFRSDRTRRFSQDRV